MAFKPERKITRGRLEILVDHDDKTEERRVSVYRGETLLAIEFVRPLDAIINNLVQVAVSRSHQFPTPRDDDGGDDLARLDGMLSDRERE